MSNETTKAIKKLFTEEELDMLGDGINALIASSAQAQKMAYSKESREAISDDITKMRALLSKIGKMSFVVMYGCEYEEYEESES